MRVSDETMTVATIGICVLTGIWLYGALLLAIHS